MPFLDKDFMEVVMHIDAEHKMIRKGAKTGYIEKWLMREAFNHKVVHIDTHTQMIMIITIIIVIKK